VQGRRHSIREISLITGIPPTTVFDIRKRETPNTKPKLGRPKVLTARDKCCIDLYIKKSKDTRQEGLENIIKALGLSIGRTALIEAIHELGYSRCIARRRPLLKKLDHKRRLAFARAHKNWTVEDWKRVIFTDEMSIKVGMDCMTIMWVWRKPGEEFHKDCVNSKKRSTGGMMFWGAFRGSKMRPGLFFHLEKDQKINSTVYRDQILLGPLKTFVNESRSEIEVPIVMEDGAPVHQGACKKLRQGLKWPNYAHPPNSPDLNPIENIWAYMKRQVTEKYRHITSQNEMRRIILEMWNNFTDDQWDGLIASMPERMKAVIAAKGGPTRY
jgi:transposase